MFISRKLNKRKLRVTISYLSVMVVESNIAECALHLGFERQTLIDGDAVDTSNVNRQNHSAVEIQNAKSDSLKPRLMSINQEAEIESKNIFLHDENIDTELSRRGDD